MMSFAGLLKYTPWLNLVLLLTITLDFYFLPVKQVREKFVRQEFELTRTSPSRSYWSYTVFTESGHKYSLPSELNWLERDSVFVINKISLLRCPSSTYFNSGGEWYSMCVGQFNSNFIVQGILVIVLILSILALIKNDMGKNFKNNLLAISVIFYAGFITTVWII